MVVATKNHEKKTTETNIINDLRKYRESTDDESASSAARRLEDQFKVVKAGYAIPPENVQAAISDTIKLIDMSNSIDQQEKRRWTAYMDGVRKFFKGKFKKEDDEKGEKSRESQAKRPSRLKRLAMHTMLGASLIMPNFMYAQEQNQQTSQQTAMNVSDDDSVAMKKLKKLQQEERMDMDDAQAAERKEFDAESNKAEQTMRNAHVASAEITRYTMKELEERSAMLQRQAQTMQQLLQQQANARLQMLDQEVQVNAREDQLDRQEQRQYRDQDRQLEIERSQREEQDQKLAAQQQAERDEQRSQAEAQARWNRQQEKLEWKRENQRIARDAILSVATYGIYRGIRSATR